MVPTNGESEREFDADRVTARDVVAVVLDRSEIIRQGDATDERVGRGPRVEAFDPVEEGA